MYERMLDKERQPGPGEIEDWLGREGFGRLCALEGILAGQYALCRELRFPFGSRYGWGFKYSHKSFHLCYAFFERGAFTVTVQIGDRQAPEVERPAAGLSPKALEHWSKRYPCGEMGGWMHIRVLEDEDITDVLKFVNLKKTPPKRA